MFYYFEIDENRYITGWSSSGDGMTGLIGLQLPEDHEFLLNPGLGYYYITSDLEIKKDNFAFLELLRTGKLAELSTDCQADIVNGFWYKMGLGTFHFYYSEQDQQNMIQNKYALEMGEESVPWRAYDENDQPIDFMVKLDQFNELFKFAVQEKNRKLKLLREYYPNLLSTLGTVEEIEAVQWDSTIVEEVG